MILPYLRIFARCIIQYFMIWLSVVLPQKEVRLAHFPQQEGATIPPIIQLARLAAQPSQTA